MNRWSISPLKGHIAEISIRKGETPAEVLSVTNTAGFVRSLDVFDKQVFSEDASNYKLVRFNDLAYNPSRINVGSIARSEFPEGEPSAQCMLLSVVGILYYRSFFSIS